MNGSTVFDYYYGDESSQFSFYRIPRQLVAGQQFKKISTDAKLLYGLLLDRMGLSARNGWYDDAGRVYIFYTLDEIQEDLNCGHEKAVKLLSELDTDKGCGLIERVKQGQGRPTKIYVKRFTTRQITAEPLAPQETPRLPKIGSQEVGKTEVKSSDNPKSRLPFFRSADFGKSDGNYIESNQTDFSYKNQSIHPSPSAEQPGWMDRSEYLREIKKNIEYPFLCQQFKIEPHFWKTPRRWLTAGRADGLAGTALDAPRSQYGKSRCQRLLGCPPLDYLMSQRTARSRLSQCAHWLTPRMIAPAIVRP